MDAENKETPAKNTPRRGRRTLRVLFVVLAIFLVLVLAAPMILSTGLGAKLATGIINDRIEGRAELARLTLSWRGPCVIKGFRLSDLQDREVLDSGKVVWKRGLWDVVTSRELFGEVAVESPNVVLYQQEEGAVSLVAAVARRAEVREESAPPSPETRAFSGTVQVSGGDLRVVQPGGREYNIRDLNALINVNAIDDVTGEVSLTLPEGGKAQADFELDQFAPGPQGAAPTGRLTAALETPAPIDLSTLSAFLGGPKVTGTLNLDVKVNMDDGAAGATLLATVAGLTAVRATALDGAPAVAADVATPVDVALAASVAGAQKASTLSEEAIADLKRKSAWMHVDAVLDLADLLGTKIDMEDLLAAVLSGKAVTMPRVDAVVDGHADLAQLGGAIPGLLHIREDTRIASGRLDIDTLKIAGGTTPSVAGEIRLADLAVDRNDQSIELAPVSMVIDARIVPDKGLTVAKASFESEFAHASLAGTAAELAGEFEMDLAKLQRQLGGVVDLKGVTLGGRVAGKLDVSRQGEERVDAIVTVDAQELMYSAQDVERSLPRAIVRLPASVTLAAADKSVRSVSTKDGEIVLNDRTALKIDFSVEPPTKALTARVRMEEGQLGDLMALAQSAGVKAPEKDIGGGLQFQLGLARHTEEGPFIINGKGSVTGLRVEEEVISEESIAFRVKDAEVATKASSATVASLAVEAGRLLDLAVDGVRVTWADRARAEGDVRLTADIGDCLAVAQRFAKWEKPPAIDGTLSWEASAATAQGLISFKGSVRIEGFESGLGDKKIAEQKITLEHDIAADPDKELLTLKLVKLNSSILSMTLNGTVGDFKTDAVCDLTGSYEAWWDRVTAVLHELAPSTAENLALAGTSAGDYRVTGPMRRLELRPSFGEASADVPFGWSECEAVGIKMGKADFHPVLENGQVNIPVATVDASGGKLRLGGVVDLAGDDTVYRLPGKTQVIDNVRIDREFADKLLSRVNPVFASLADLEATLSLGLEDIDVPLGEGIKTTGQGKGRVAIRDLKVIPKGFMAVVLQLGGYVTEGRLDISVSDLDFVIRDGHIHYDNFVLTVDEDFDMAFRGSVGFDSTLELWVSLPIRPALLEKFGAKGAVAEYARILAEEGVRVEVPIAGDRLHPKLGNVDVQPLVKRAAKALLEKGAKEQLSDLLKRETESKDDAPAEMPESETPEKDGPAGEGEKAKEEKEKKGLLDGLLKGVQEQQNREE